MPVTVPQTEVTLLSYFETADQPTQDQFEEFIRTMFYLYQLAQDTANDAAADAADAVSHMSLAMVNAHYVSGTSYTLDTQQNVSSVQTRRISDSVLDTLATGTKLRINFTTPIADSAYVAIASPSDSVSTPRDFTVIARTVNYIEYQIGTAGFIVNRFELVIFHP